MRLMGDTFPGPPPCKARQHSARRFILRVGRDFGSRREQQHNLEHIRGEKTTQTGRLSCRGWEQTLSFAPGNSAEGMGEVMASSEEVGDEPGGTTRYHNQVAHPCQDTEILVPPMSCFNQSITSPSSSTQNLSARCPLVGKELQFFSPKFVSQVPFGRERAPVL